MTILNLILITILSISLAELAIQMHISELAARIKGLLYLDQEQKLSILGKPDFWIKLFVSL